MKGKNEKPIKTSTKLFALGILTTIVFVILKLVHVIAWSWLWVIAPLWILIILFIFASLITGIINDIKTWRK